MKLSAVQKVNFALSLIEVSCKLLNREEKEVFSIDDSGNFSLVFRIEQWLKEMHDAVIILRQATKGKKEIIWQKDQSLKERILKIKRYIHTTVSVVEGYMQESEKKEEITYPIYELEQAEISLLSCLECLSWGEYDSRGVSVIKTKTVVQPKQDEKDKGTPFHKEKDLWKASLSNSFIYDFFAAQKAIFKGIPYDCARMYKQSPLTALVVVLLFPITLFIYLIVGFHECRQRRHMYQFFHLEYQLDQELKKYRSAEGTHFPSRSIDQYFHLVCPLASRLYEFHIRPLLKGLPWRTVGDLINYAEQDVGNKVSKDLISIFEELRIQVGQIYAGNFEEFEQEVLGRKSSIDQAIKEREDLVSYHLQHFENILAEFCAAIELKQKQEEEVENKKIEAAYNSLRIQLMLSGLEKLVEIGVINIKEIQSGDDLVRYLHQVEMMAVLQELQTPTLNTDNCPHTHEHSEMLIKLKRLRRAFFELHSHELEFLTYKTLDPHYILPRNLEHRIEILKMSERRIPVQARMIFQNPKFNALEFFKSSAAKWIFSSEL